MYAQQPEAQGELQKGSQKTKKQKGGKRHAVHTPKF